MLRPVVVGVDGSPESLAAADWAAGEALRRGLPLLLVHAWEGLPSDASSLPELEAPRHWARRILLGSMDRLHERHPQVRLGAEQIARPATDALVAAGAEGELLVLGSRAFSGLGGFMAGSVALTTVAHVTRPVILVRADRTAEDDHLPDGDGRPSTRTPYREVVVGVDTAHPCDELLAFALESAALRSAPLRVVHAWHVPYAQRAAVARMSAVARQAAELALEGMLRPWREKYPSVQIQERVEHARPSQLLLEASQGAGLLVVGRRVRPPGHGAHTGPVTHAVMHHVRCPVAVVPHE